jgi:glycosyltransferase involved in cell wall biosynthesis
VKKQGALARRGPPLWYIAQADLSAGHTAGAFHSRQDVKELRSSGWQARLFASAFSRRRYLQQPAENVFFCRRSITGRIFFEVWLLWNLLLTNERPQFVLFRGPTTLVGVAAMLKLMSIPYGVELHGLVTCTGARGILRTAFVRSATCVANWASLLLPVTREIAENAVSGKRRGIKITVVPNGADVVTYCPTDAVEGRGDLGLRLGFVGNLVENRGLTLSLEVVSILAKQQEDVVFTIVGDGPLRPQLKEKALQLGVERNVRFEGAVPYEMVPRRIAPCDLMLALLDDSDIVRRTGASPLKVFSSLACGKPVLLKALPVMKELLGVPGVFPCAGRTASEIARQIIALWRALGRDGLRQRGLLGREFVVGNYSWRHHAERIHEAMVAALARCR